MDQKFFFKASAWRLLCGLTFAAMACQPSADESPTVVPLSGDSCLTCHEGIEQAHPGIDDNSCVVCHGGNADATTKEEAHIAVPENYTAVRGTGKPAASYGYIKDLAPNQLDALDPAYIRFINPGDIRAAEAACGECHAEEVENQKNSIMTTNAGHYMPTLHYAGFQGQDAIYGSYPATDPNCDPSIPGTVCELIPLEPGDDDLLEAALQSSDIKDMERLSYDHYLSKSCNTCHAAGYGKNNAPHLYRSTGCSSCHVVYNKDGVYTGSDPTIRPGLPVHADKHKITKQIPTQQCATCHFQGGRIGLLYQGIREGGFKDTPPNAEVWAESAYGHAAGYYILDEDTTNNIDETPPDVHAQLGMVCGDCHVGSDVHGDGRLYSTSKGQVDVSCEDCHGSARERTKPNGEGQYLTTSGRLLKQLYTNSSGDVALKGLMDGKEHVVPQPADILNSGQASASMRLAMSPDDKDWSHTDSLTCDTCHNSHQQFCVGCHVSYDMRFSSTDQQTGLPTTGLVRGSRQTYSLDDLLLSQGVDGRAQATNPSQQVQMSIFDWDGELIFGEFQDEELTKPLGVFRENEYTNAQVGMSPFFQHTTSKYARRCETCHALDSSEEEQTRVKGVYGFGTGEFMLPDPYGPDVDALRFINEDYEQTTSFVHPGTGPLSREVIDRALSVRLDTIEGARVHE